MRKKVTGAISGAVTWLATGARAADVETIAGTPNWLRRPARAS